MKKSIIVAVFLIVNITAFSQSLDRTNWNGKIVSSEFNLQTWHDQKRTDDFSTVKTTISIDDKTITIVNKNVNYSYSIDSKRFDSPDMSVFNCTDSDGNKYELKYTQGYSMNVIADSNIDVYYRYTNVSELPTN